MIRLSTSRLTVVCFFQEPKDAGKPNLSKSIYLTILYLLGNRRQLGLPLFFPFFHADGRDNGDCSVFFTTHLKIKSSLLTLSKRAGNALRSAD